jgi:ABC-type multidrug transport system fused ATPase/permease subunit
VTLVILPLIALMFLVTHYYQKDSELIAEKNMLFGYHLAGYIRELLNKYKTLLLFGNLEFEKNYFKNLIKKYNQSINNSSFWKNFILNSLGFLNLTVNGIVVLFGAYLIKQNLEKNIEIKGIENIFSFQTGQIMSLIVSVFSFDFLFRDIFNFLKDLTDSFKAAQNYYDLEIFERKKIQKLKNERIIEISDSPYRNENFDIINLEIKELNFLDVSFDYKFLITNDKNEPKKNK